MPALRPVVSRTPLAAVALALFAFMLVPAAAADETVTVGKLTFVNHGLVGVGRMPADLRDKFGETFGSGSGLAVDANLAPQTADGYHGTLYLLPDRGYNVTGTTDYRARLNTVSIVLHADRRQVGRRRRSAQRSFAATLTDSILLTDAAGRPLTGLDPSTGGIRPAADGFPELPQAANGAVSLDAEAVVPMPDGSFFVSDEYGPYIYRFSADGRMLSAIRPPDAFIPQAQRRRQLLLQQSRTRAPRRRSRPIRTSAGRTTRASRAWR